MALIDLPIMFNQHALLPPLRDVLGGQRAIDPPLDHIGWTTRVGLIYQYTVLSGQNVVDSIHHIVMANTSDSKIRNISLGRTLLTRGLLSISIRGSRIGDIQWP